MSLSTKQPITRSSSTPLGLGSQGRGPALTLTFIPHPAYDPTGAPAGVPVWVTEGTAGGVLPSTDVWEDPIGYVTAAGSRYVWAKVGLSETVSLLATSLELVSSTSPTGYATAAFGSAGELPAHLYVPLGVVTAVGAGPAITLSSYGAGSIVVGLAIHSITRDDLGRPLQYGRHLSYWRVGAT